MPGMASELCWGLCGPVEGCCSGGTEVCRKPWLGLCLHSLSRSAFCVLVFSLILTWVLMEDSWKEQPWMCQKLHQAPYRKPVWSLGRPKRSGMSVPSLAVRGQLRRTGRRRGWDRSRHHGGTWSWSWGRESKSHDSIARPLVLLSSCVRGCQELGLMDSTRTQLELLMTFFFFFFQSGKQHGVEPSTAARLTGRPWHAEGCMGRKSLACCSCSSESWPQLPKGSCGFKGHDKFELPKHA